MPSEHNASGRWPKNPGGARNSKGPNPPKNPLSRLAAYLAGALALVAAVTFSLFLLIAVFLVGLAAWAYLGWRKRKQQRALQEDLQGQSRGRNEYKRYGAQGARRAGPDGQNAGEGEVIEGEATRIADEQDSAKR